MFKQKELPFQNAQTSFSGSNLAAFSGTGLIEARHQFLSTRALMDRNLLFFSVFLKAFFPAYAILPHVKLNTVSPEQLY